MPEQAGYERAAAHAGEAGGMDAGTFAVSGTELQTANQRPYLYLLRHLSTTYKPGINYSNPDMRQIEAQSAKKSLPPATADLGGAHTSTAGAARTGQHSGTAIERSGTRYYRIIRVKSY